jgi:hypothetical protein
LLKKPGNAISGSTAGNRETTMNNPDSSRTSRIVNPVGQNNLSKPSLQIPVDLLVALNGDFGAAFILSLLQSQDWIPLSLQQIEALSFGAIKEKKARTAIRLLVCMGLVEQDSKPGEFPLFKINQGKLDALYSHSNMPNGSSALWEGYPSCLGGGVLPNGRGLPYLYIYNNNNKNADFSQNNNYPIGKLYLQSEQQTTDLEKVEVETELTQDPTKTVLSAFKNRSAKFKTEQSKRKLSLLVSRYGDKIGKVIEEYGEENTLEGIIAFIEDPYWQERDLPIEAFLKFPHQWTKDKDGSVTPYNAPKKTTGSRYRKYSAASPASSNAQETASRIESVVSVGPPPTRDRMRVMRRNEALMLLSACKSLRWQEHKDKFNSEFWQMSDQEIDDIVDMAAIEFKTLTGRECLVVSRPLVKPEKETA